MTDATRATCVYCLVRRPDAPPLDAAPEGLPDCAAPRALHASGELWAVVAEAPLDVYGQQPLNERLEDLDWVSRCAMAHEELVEHVVGAGGTVIPMQLFTLFADDERVRAHLEDIRARLDEIFDRLAGCEEWGVRLRVDRAAEERAARQRARQTARGGSGADFLRGKKAARDERSQAKRDAAEQASAVFEALREHAAEARRRPLVQPEDGSATLLLDAAFLVPTEQVNRFENAVRERAAELADGGFELVASGPWPPYHFVEEAER